MQNSNFSGAPPLGHISAGRELSCAHSNYISRNALASGFYFSATKPGASALRLMIPLLSLTSWLALLTLPSVAQEKSTLVRPTLDAQCQAFVKATSEQPQTDWDAIVPIEARRSFAGLTMLFGTGPADVRTEDRKILSTIPIRVYKPAATKMPISALPVVVYFHGGGWVLGDIDTHDALCRRLCDESGCVIVSIGYRLAPEHPFPAPLDDCYTATEFISSHAEELGVDPTRLIVAGDSAGGNLAAAVAIKARNKKGPKILAQVLIYPALDPNCASASYELFSEGYGLTKTDMVWFWETYTSHKKIGVYAAPSQAQSFASLPKTLIITAQCDVLRDEGEQFAGKLESAGIAVTHRRYDGMIHGFVHFSGAIDAGKRATTDIAAWIKRSVKNPTAE